MIQALADAPAWSDMRPETLATEGAALVELCQSFSGLSFRELRYVEFNYLARFEHARPHLETFPDDYGSLYTRPVTTITVPPEHLAAWRRAWSKVYVLHRIYFAVPDSPPPGSAPSDPGPDRLYPLERTDSGFRLTGVWQPAIDRIDPRKEFAWLAYTWGSRQTGRKVSYAY